MALKAVSKGSGGIKLEMELAIHQFESNILIMYNFWRSLILIFIQFNTDIPAYSDTGYSDTPLTVTLWAGPKSFINRMYGYSDTNICFQWHFWRQFELKNH